MQSHEKHTGIYRSTAQLIMSTEIIDVVQTNK